MDTQNQFAVFTLCVCVGFVGGIIYEFFALAALPFGCARGKNRWLRIALDIAFWLCFSVLAVWSAYKLKFPDFRLYIWAGYLLGGILYLKTLRRIVAFLEKMCYNKLTKRLKRRENKGKNLKKVEREI